MKEVWIFSERQHGATYDIQDVFDTAEAAIDAAQNSFGVDSTKWVCHGDWYSQNNWDITRWSVQS